MPNPVEVLPQDGAYYARHIAPLLPDRIVDIHAHVWLKRHKAGSLPPQRVVSWPSRVAAEQSIEDLQETYRLLFPGKQVRALVFGDAGPGDPLDAVNAYVAESARGAGYPALLFATPQWGAMELEERLLAGGFAGVKVYLTLAPGYLPEKEIRIFDFLPPHQLEVLSRLGAVVMLHIPRDGRLGDPVNLAQMVEIEQRYPGVRLIIAHVGRAYCPEDVGNAFDVIARTERMLFDFSANCNQGVFERLIGAVGPRRILFGSDLPILRMRGRRVCEHGNYVNLVPPGLYGDVSQDSHMREAPGESLTFLLYESIRAFLDACRACGLGQADIDRVFYHNAAELLRLEE